LLYYGFENPEKVYVEKFALPSSGTDSVVVNPQNASTGSITLTAYNASDVTGSITPTTEGESETVSIPAPGQKARITFAGTVGKTVTIKTSESSIASGWAWILNLEGEKIGSEEPIGSGRFEVTPTATGTYTVYLSPSGKDTGSVKVTAYLGSHPGAMILRGPSASIQTEGSGTRLSDLPNSGLSAPSAALDVSTVGTPVTHDATDIVRVADGKSAGREAGAQQPRHVIGARPQDRPHVAGPVSVRTIKISPFHLADSGVWQPLAHGHHALWETGWPSSPWREEPPLYATAGTTALSGQALQIDGMPLAGVRLSIEGTTAKTETDAQGRFLLTGASAGHQVLVIEGEPSHHSGARYGTYEMGATLVAGKTTTLEETVWLTPLDPAGDRSVGSPVKHEVRLTTPQIPGLEVRIPAGTVITDAAGKKVHNLNLSAIPVDRPPFRLPAFVEVPIYFTVQPGRAYLSKAAQIIYPNYEHLRPGQRVPFWDYDADSRGWYVYGHGTVTPNGKQIVPDPSVGIWEFSGAMISNNPTPPSSKPTGTGGGDPVDLYSGLFDYHTTDLVLPDTIPIVMQRSYRQADSNSYSFGIGTTDSYDLRLWSENNYHEADLILPDGGRVHYVRVSSGEGYAEAEYKSTSKPGPFYASTIKWNTTENAWDLSLTDGLTYEFGDNAPLDAIRDRFGDQLTITRTEGQKGLITQITSPHGRWVTFSYDSSNRIKEMKDNGGRVWKYSYTTAGYLEKVTDPAERVTKYEYDGSGNMISITDPRGTKYIENEYDAHDRVSKQKDADGGVFEFKYALGGEGQVESTTVTEPRENKRKVTFNSEGFSTSEILGYESALEEKTEIERQASTNLILSTTDARKRKTAYEYDAYGNPMSITRLAGTASAQTTKFTYEPQTNELTKVTDPLGHSTKYEYGSKSELLTITDPLGHKTTAEYNSSGQPTVIKNALGKSTTYAYELGLLSSITDADSRTTKQFVDGVGNVTSVTRPEGQRTLYGYNLDNELTSITGAGGAQTSFEYDADGDLTSVTDPRHNKTTATYESMDRLESETDPLGHKTSWAYNKAGYPTEATDRRGLVTKATYDTLGRMSKISFGVSGETAQSSIKYEYDNGNRPTKIEDSAGGTYTPTYDELDRLTALSGPNGTIEYTYDGADRRKKLIVPGQEAIEYTYDEANRLTELARGTEKIKLGYDNANRLTTVKLLDGIEELLGYNEASDPTSIIDKKGSETLGELDYSYDKDDQLEATWGSYARTGLPEAITTPLVYNADNELTEREGKKLTYDNDGNLTSDGTNEYKWDDRGQLENISGGTTASFGYDPFGRRSSKTLAGTTTKLLYDGPNVVQESVGGTATGNLITGLGADQIFSRKTSAGTDSYLTNSQKSTIALANSEGKVKTTYTYDPFGTTTTEGTASTNPYQYTGRENDGDGLQYNRARYYNPANARFISQDPTGFPGSGANLYQYTLGDPLDFTDPTGRCSLEFWTSSFWTEGNCASENPVKAIQAAGIGACTIATVGGCVLVTGLVFSAGLYSDVSCGASAGQFAGTIGFTLLGAGPGLIFGGLSHAGMITEKVLPDTMAGKWALNGYLTGPAAGAAVAEGAANGPGGPGGSSGGASGGSSGGSSSGGSTGGSAAASSGEGGGCE
jgi:RHS repeat-associated protein